MQRVTVTPRPSDRARLDVIEEAVAQSTGRSVEELRADASERDRARATTVRGEQP